MKLTFFLIAIGLILVRLCLPQLEMWHNGREQGTMITKGDHYYEGIWWSGKYRLSDDDRSIAEISPGGYVKFRENDTTMKAESDLQGRVSYTLYDGRENLPLNDSGRNFLARQLQKMIGLGFFGEQRAERIYAHGGVPALLVELSRIKMEGGRDPYLKVLSKSDSLTVPQRIELLQITDGWGNTSDKQNVLNLFTPEQLRDSLVAQEWLKSVSYLDGSDNQKDLLLHYIGADLPVDRFDTVLAITRRFGSDDDRQEVYKKLIDLPQLREYDSGYARPWLYAVGQLGPSDMKKDLLLQYLDTSAKPRQRLPADQFDSVMTIAGRLADVEDRKDILELLIGLPPATDDEWISLIHATGVLQPDEIKGEVLLKMAPQLPRSDSLRALFRLTAKSIQSDDDYGKVMRAVE